MPDPFPETSERAVVKTAVCGETALPGQLIKVGLDLRASRPEIGGLRRNPPSWSANGFECRLRIETGLTPSLPRLAGHFQGNIGKGKLVSQLFGPDGFERFFKGYIFGQFGEEI